jgi:hypothetical protein
MVVRGSEQDAWLDAQVRRTDPVRRDADARDIAVAVREAGALILAQAERDLPRRRRVLWSPRRMMLIGALVFGASGAAAAASGVFVNANTHTYAQRSDLRHGSGPGEFLNPAGTNYIQVVKQDSAGAGITFPSGRFDWRSYAIQRFRPPTTCRVGSRRIPVGSSPACPRSVESTGSIDVNIAQSAFCAWVLQWRYAEMTHNAAGARQAAAVIAQAPRWKAISDDRGISGYEASFRWLPPFVRAVAAGDVNQVNELIGRQGGAWFWLDDPDGFAVAFAKHVEALPRARARTVGREEGAYYLRYLNQHGS